MPDRPAFDQIDLVAADFDATLAFYRRLGVEIDDGPEGDLRHANMSFGDVNIHVDNEALASVYSSAWRGGDRSRVVLGFNVPSREAVDALYAELTGAGYEGRQQPWDAFWGARYAIVADPDGNNVGIMSPSDDTKRVWPPTPSPA